ncbi:hypothetical protein HYN48_02150 [Flavobacterium magnum]|uniref:Periplasmic heavy metal sensor n=1 Tax=Flavobacterium magnum TaxID=2162713 RepID=A0A2S0RE46_9FLAO|nr:hypothetical protein [Flavobacterium magnum]AWA28982.1 hypothetical protein HYN48_02150 [Flavobacterium magnum]
MKKVKVLTVFCITLVALNLLLIATTLMERREHRGKRPDDKKNTVIHELHFDKAQITEYEKLIDWHRSHVRNADAKIMAVKNRLYESLAGTETDWRRNDSLMAEIGKVQVEIEHIHYKHFQDIKSLCRKDQLPYYNSMATRIAAIFSNPKPRP